MDRNLDVRLQDPESEIDLSSLISMDNFSDLRVYNEAVFSVPLLETITRRSDLTASSGGVLMLPSLRSYEGGESTLLTATGPGSRVELPALISLMGSDRSSYPMLIEASAGGVIDLSSVVNMDRNLDVRLQDSESEIYLSSLIGMDDYSNLRVYNEAVFSVPLLETITGGSDLTASSGGVLMLPSLRSYEGIESSRLTATGPGSRVELPALISLMGSTRNDRPMTIEVCSEAVVDMSSIQSMSRNLELHVFGMNSELDVSSVRSLSSSVDLRAYEGATLSLPALNTYTSGGDNTFVQAFDTSQIQLPVLSSLEGSTSGGRRFFLDAFYGGDIALGDGTVGITRYVQTNATTGVISAGELFLSPGTDFSGAGTLTSDVVNSGLVTPGASNGGVIGGLTIAGDYTQTRIGTLSLKIRGYAPSTEFDQLNVSGQAQLCGTLDVTRVGGFAPALGDNFDVLTFGSASGDFHTKNGVALDGGLAFATAYESDRMALRVVENQPPTVDSLGATPDPVARGADLTLTADGVADLNGSVESVVFYWDADADGTLRPCSDVLLGTDIDGIDGWSVTASTAVMPLGIQTFFARAKDNDSLDSNIASVTATVSKVYVWWDGGGDGTSWSDAANWSGDLLPGPNDDVLIDDVTDPVVILNSGSVSVKSLESEEALVVTGGSLTVTAPSVIQGSLTMSEGAGIVADGSSASLDVRGTAVLGGANVVARNGGQMNFLGATSYAASWGGASPVIQASGSGSMVDLSSITDELVGNATYGHGAALLVKALDGGLVNLSNVLTAREKVQIFSEGNGSLVDLRSLETLDGGNYGYENTSAVTIRQGGQVDLSSLATVKSAGLMAYDGLTLSLPSIVTYEGATDNGGVQIIQASGAGSRVDLSHLSGSFLGESGGKAYQVIVKALDGGVVDLSNATSMLHKVQILAQGSGSLVDLQSLETLDGGNYGYENTSAVTIRQGGQVDLSSLATVKSAGLMAYDGLTLSLPSIVTYEGATDNGGVQIIQASGAGSRVDLSHLSGSFLGESGGKAYQVIVKALDGGVVDLSNAASMLHKVQILSEGDGSLVDLRSLETLDGGNYGYHNTTSVTIRQDGQVDLSSLATVRSAGLMAYDGLTLSLPVIVSYQGMTYSNGNDTIQASGAGSRVDLSNLTGGFLGQSVYGNGAKVYVKALDGGVVDLSNATSMTDKVQILGQGSGSFVDLRSLDTLDGGNYGYDNTTSVTIQQDGQVDLSSLATVKSAGLMAYDGLTLSLPVIVSYQGMTYSNGNDTIQASGAGSRVDLSNLTGGFLGQSVYGNGAKVYVKALDGGVVDLSNATSMTDKVQILGQGSGSFVDLRSLDTLDGGNYGYRNTTSVTIREEGRVDLSNLATVKCAGLIAHDGLTLSLPLATLYAGPESNGGSFDILADGVGSTVSLPALQIMTGSQHHKGVIDINATNGGAHEFPALETVNGTARFRALTGGVVSLNPDGVTTVYGPASVTTDATGTVFVDTLRLVDEGWTSGGGTIVGNVENHGDVNVGRPLGILKITGDYFQGLEGALNIEMSGDVPGSGFDQFTVSGHARLCGTVAVSRLNGFLPTLGDSFQIVTFGTGEGEFASKSGVDLTGGLTMSTAYGVADVTLHVVENVPPTIASLSAAPDPVNQGTDLAFNAQGVADPNGHVGSVAFYRDADGDGILRICSDILVGTDTNESDGWGLAVLTDDLPLGIHTFFARARDNDGLDSSIAATTIDCYPPADFGDAPSPYPTLLADDGARHLAMGPTLGANRDTEADGQPTDAADGDDIAGTPDDEDGVTFGPIVVGPPAATIIETVAIGNPGNPDDTHEEGYGGVSYAYNMGKYEVTAGQYTVFLNAVAGIDNYGLYNTTMWSSTDGCRIERYAGSGTVADPYQYRVDPYWENRPVNYVSWGDAARFANWLHNGRGSGDTEDGAYFLDGVTGDAALLAVTREADWEWAISSEDEWYKAAYHKNDGATGNYFDYPTNVDSPPSYELTDPDLGNNATFRAANGDYTIGSPDWRTEVGAHENSESPYGTFDQGGNMWEWNETVVSGGRNLRGGSYVSGFDAMLASNRTYNEYPASEFNKIGFRVTSAVPQASSLDASVTVNVQDAAEGAKLDAWIDFNADGIWGGPFEQIADALVVVNGDNTITFDVPTSAVVGTTHARFRLSTTGNLAPTGQAADGEVEDYQVVISASNPPVIENQTFSLAENSDPLTVVGTAVTTDPDLPADVLTWSITEGNTGTAFAIDPNTGEIIVANSTALDFETMPTFNLTVEVTDSDGNSDTAVVAVNLTDIETEVALSGGDLTITDIDGGDSADTLTLSVVGSDLVVSDPNNLLETQIAGATGGGTNTVTVPLTAFTGKIIVNTLAGDDSLTVDFSTGNFTRVIDYNGGDPTSGPADSLTLRGGGQFTNAVFRYDNSSDGSIDITGNSTIRYTGLEPITSNISATNVTLNYGSTGETIEVTDATGGETTVASTAGETTTFNNPTGTLTINAGGGDDTVNIASLAASYPANVTIDGQTGSDTVNINGAISLSGAHLTVTADTIDVNGGISTSGGNVGLTATDGVTVQAAIDTGGGEVTVDADSDDDGTGTFTLDAGGDNFVTWSVPVGNTATGTLPGGITVTATATEAFDAKVGGMHTGSNYSPEQTSGNSLPLRFNQNDSVTLSLSSSVRDPFIHFNGAQGPLYGSLPLDVYSFDQTPAKAAGTSNWIVSSNNIRQDSGSSFEPIGGTARFSGDISSIIMTRIPGMYGSFPANGDGVSLTLGYDGGGAGSISTGGASVSITAATVDLQGPIAGTGTLELTPSQAASTIGLGGATGDFNLDDAELGNLTDGFSSITIGDPTSGTGTVNIDTATFTDPVTIAGGVINDNAGTDITAPSVTLDGNVSPGQSPGVLSVAGNLTFAAGDTFTVEVNGTAIGGAGVTFDQVDVTGVVTIGNTVALTIDATDLTAGEIADGDEYVLINNDGSDATTDTFDGLAEGDQVVADVNGLGFALDISYAGGSNNNDVVLTARMLNSPPVANDDTTTTDEDIAIDVDVLDLGTPDSDPDIGDTINITQVGSTMGGANMMSAQGGTLAINNNGTPADPTDDFVAYTPPANFNGTDAFFYTVEDTGGLTDSAEVTITVSAVNDAPSFSKRADEAVLEDAGAQSVAQWASAISAGPADESGQALTFNVDNDNNGLFSAQPAIAADGTLTYTPAADANGSATVTVSLSDDGGTANGGMDTSADQAFVINVSAANDAPVVVAPIVDVSVNEDAANTVIDISGVFDDVDIVTNSDSLSFSVSNDNSGLISASLAGTTLTLDYQENQNGTTNITVTATDTQGPAAVSDTFLVTVAPANDAPVLTGILDVTFDEDSSDNSIALDMYFSDVETLAADATFAVVSTFSGLTASIDSVSHVLTISGDSNFSGEGDITVRVTDTGDGSSPQLFAEDTLHVKVVAVADTPTLTISPYAEGVEAAEIPLSIAATLNDTDGSETLSITITGVPAGASLSAGADNSGGNWTLNPAAGDLTDLTITASDDSTFNLTVTAIAAEASNGNTTGTADTITVTVNNVAPTLVLDPVTTISEDGTATLTGTITDPGTLDTFALDVNWGDPLSPNDSETYTYAASTTGSQAFTLTHQYLDDNPTGTASDVYTIGVTLTDDDTGTDSAHTTTMVTNVAPVITTFETDSPFCGGAAENDVVTATLVFDDPGTLDTHTVVIDWGDESIDAIELASTPTNGTLTLEPTHAYAAGGVYDVTVTVTDDDEGSDSNSTTVVVSGVGVVGNTLYVIGTANDDHVTINQTGKGTFKVHADFLPDPSGPRNVDPAGVDQINVFLCWGDDHATISSGITTPALIDGGQGSDHLNGGGGPNVILGGDGDDHIMGGGLGDILIGGAGMDRLVGNGGEDVMIGGSTTFDSDYDIEQVADQEALFDFLADWNSTDSREDRELALQALVDAVLDDGDEDKLTGSSGEDWFLARLEDIITDITSSGKGGKKK